MLYVVEPEQHPFAEVPETERTTGGALFPLAAPLHTVRIQGCQERTAGEVVQSYGTSSCTIRLAMISRYADEALCRARYDDLDDGTFYAEVPGLRKADLGGLE